MMWPAEGLFSARTRCDEHDVLPLGCSSRSAEAPARLKKLLISRPLFLRCGRPSPRPAAAGACALKRKPRRAARSAAGRARTWARSFPPNKAAVKQLASPLTCN
eukprot:358811-Chlamydomonas_euryale.AAC.7